MTKEEVSFWLGMSSLVFWSVAEIPQIITNYQTKSGHGVSFALLLTWVIGDVFNLVGCMLEPATLPTQFYTAVVTTLSLPFTDSSTIFREREERKRMWERERERQRIERERGRGERKSVSVGEKGRRERERERERERCDLILVLDSQLYTAITVILVLQTLYYGYAARWRKPEHVDINPQPEVQGGKNSDDLRLPLRPAAPIPLTASSTPSSRSEIFYTSARSLANSGTPTFGSYLGARDCDESPPLRRSAVPSLSPGRGVLVGVCASLPLPAKGFRGALAEPGFDGRAIGVWLGWIMAAIYMGGRLPQIILNIKRGSIEGLNPAMFLLAVLANASYVGSILVSSVEWKRIRANVPWLLDAAVCVLLDLLVSFLRTHRKRRIHPLQTARLDPYQPLIHSTDNQGERQEERERERERQRQRDRDRERETERERQRDREREKEKEREREREREREPERFYQLGKYLITFFSLNYDKNRYYCSLFTTNRCIEGGKTRRSTASKTTKR